MRPSRLSRAAYVALVVPFGLLGALRACTEAALRRLGWIEPDDSSWIPGPDPLLRD